MDKLLDKVVHPSYKAPSLVTYLTPRHAACHSPPTSTSSDNPDNPDDQGPPRGPGGGACAVGTHGGQSSKRGTGPTTDGQRPEGSGASGSGTTCTGTRPKTTLSYTLSYGQR